MKLDPRLDHVAPAIFIDLNDKKQIEQYDLSKQEIEKMKTGIMAIRTFDITNEKESWLRRFRVQPLSIE